MYLAALEFQRTTLAEQRALTAIYLGIAETCDKRPQFGPVDEDYSESCVETL